MVYIFTIILLLLSVCSADDVKTNVSVVASYRDCDCGPHSSYCYITFNDQLLCTCYLGYSQTNTTLNGKCEKCDCGFFGKCKFVLGSKKCDCENGFVDVRGTCEAGGSTAPPCDCGEHGTCREPYGIKRCYCDSGYAEKLGRCEECDCGDGTCEFVGGAKVCTCNKDLIEVRGKCQECDCGENSISCKLSSLILKRKECTCKPGYAVLKSYVFSDEECKKCDCGSYGVSCSFSRDGFLEKQTCDCKYGSYNTREREGRKCKECECGTGSLSCRFIAGERRCDCAEGYKSSKETGSYYGDEYCTSTSYGKVSGSISGWRLGTYILAAFFLITIFGLVIAIVSKNWILSTSSL